MKTPLSPEELQQQLEELEILEQQEKARIQELEEQLAQLTEEEIQERKKIEELRKQQQQAIKKNINTPPSKIKQHLHKIRKTALILGITGGVITGIHEIGKQHIKRKKTPESEIIEDRDSHNIPIEENILSMDSLIANIALEDIEKTITYETIHNHINNIINNKTRRHIIEYIHQGDIIGMQIYLGMHPQSQYPSNKASGKIDRKTLERMSDPYFGLYGKDILNHKNIPQTVKEIYNEFLLGEIDNSGANYIIISKEDFHLYLFTQDHTLLHRQVCLLGKDISKEGKRVPYEYYNTNKGIVYHNEPVNTNTPPGLYLISDIKNLKQNYITDGPKTSIILTPIDKTTYTFDQDRYESNKYSLEIHPIYQPPQNPKEYATALQSETIEDNATSHGCINIGQDGIVKDNIDISKSKVYIQ